MNERPEHYKEIGKLAGVVEGLKESVSELKDAVKDMHTLIIETNKTFVNKKDYTKMEAKVDMLYGRLKYIAGAAAVILFLLNKFF